MDKKWYNYFVSTDEPGSPEAETPAPQASQTPLAAPRKPIAPPSASAAQAVAQIAATVQPPPEAKFTSAVAAAASFDEIYKAAEIPVAAHGYTILKISDMLNNEHIRDMAPTVKRSTVLVALDAAGVKIQEVIQDAVRRDKALDTYELVQEKGIQDLENKKSQENRQLQAELDKLRTDYEARIRKNNDAVAREKERFAEWRLKKQQEEQKIADAVSHFASPNPITTGPATRPPSAPANPEGAGS